MSVIGLDLSLTAPGLAVTDRTETLRTDAKRGDKRLCDIRMWITHYAHTRAPRLAMIEAVPPYDHASAVLRDVHGVAREVLAQFDIPYAYVNVSALKAYATGDGRADKKEVMRVVREDWDIDVEDDNAADAAVLRAMGGTYLSGLGGTVPTLSAVEWPLTVPRGYVLPEPLPEPYGPLQRKPTTKKCKHGMVCLKNGDHWLHPFNVAVCDKPPAARKTNRTRKEES